MSIGNFVTCCASPPPVPISQIWREPERLETKATVLLSGHQEGDDSLTSLAAVSCRRLTPSAFITHKLVVGLFDSASHARTVKTIDLPSGDTTGSPTRGMRTMSWTQKG